MRYYEDLPEMNHEYFDRELGDLYSAINHLGTVKTVSDLERVHIVDEAYYRGYQAAIRDVRARCDTLIVNFSGTLYNQKIIEPEKKYKIDFGVTG